MYQWIFCETQEKYDSHLEAILFPSPGINITIQFNEACTRKLDSFNRNMLLQEIILSTHPGLYPIAIEIYFWTVLQEYH